MLRVRPFHALRPAGSRAALVSCPPPPAVEESHPDTAGSYQQVFDAQTAEGASLAIRRLVDAGALCADSVPNLYIYRIARGGHRVLGIVAAVERADLDGSQAEPQAAEWREPAIALFDDPEGTIAGIAICDMNERPIFHFNACDGTTHSAWIAHEVSHYIEAFAALAGRATLVANGAAAGPGRVLTLLIERSHASDGTVGPHPVPRCGLFVQRSVIAS